MSKPPGKEPEKPIVVEALPQARSMQTQKALGNLARQAASLAKPGPTGPGASSTPNKVTQRIDPGAVGLRKVPQVKPMEETEVSAVASEEKRKVTQRVTAIKDEHRQKVFEKLDTAKRAADARAARLRGFQPARENEPGKDDDFDF